MKSAFGAVLNRCFLVILLAPSVGCASLAPAVIQSNNHVQMPHYSFVVPPTTDGTSSGSIGTRVRSSPNALVHSTFK